MWSGQRLLLCVTIAAASTARRAQDDADPARHNQVSALAGAACNFGDVPRSCGDSSIWTLAGRQLMRDDRP